MYLHLGAPFIYFLDDFILFHFTAEQIVHILSIPKCLAALRLSRRLATIVWFPDRRWLEVMFWILLLHISLFPPLFAASSFHLSISLSLVVGSGSSSPPRPESRVCVFLFMVRLVSPGKYPPGPFFWRRDAKVCGWVSLSGPSLLQRVHRMCAYVCVFLWVHSFGSSTIFIPTEPDRPAGYASSVLQFYDF